MLLTESQLPVGQTWNGRQAGRDFHPQFRLKMILGTQASTLNLNDNQCVSDTGYGTPRTWYMLRTQDHRILMKVDGIP